MARRQVAALPPRQSKGRALEILLITSRDTRPLDHSKRLVIYPIKEMLGRSVVDADQLDHAAHGLTSGNRRRGHS